MKLERKVERYRETKPDTERERERDDVFSCIYMDNFDMIHHMFLLHNRRV